MPGVCKVHSEKEVKCKPHKFYELMKYSLHHLPTVFPEGYKECQLLEGDPEKAGSVYHVKYELPGNPEQRFVKIRTTVQDDEKMTISFYVEDGTLHGHFKHFVATFHARPKGEGSLVKWTVEFEKHRDDIQDPHSYLELFDTLTHRVDEYVHSTEK